MKSSALLVTAIVLFLLSCSRDVDVVYPDPLFPSDASFKATLFIRVLGDYGRPVGGARVHIGPIVKETDLHGWVTWTDATVTSSTYLTVEHDGFFNTSRRIYPQPNSTNYVKFILLSNSNPYSFSAMQGKTIATLQGFEILFPIDAYQLENGDSYTGEVSASIQPLSIDDPEMSFKMPGDLTGRRMDNTIGQLASMGMIGVELHTMEGDKLELKKDQHVEIHFPVSDDRLSKAPGVIPMWYYDEELGIWKEEGQALLNGNHYVARVSHFSFWNCDAFYNMVSWSGSFSSQDDAPLTYANVCITIDNLNSKRCTYLNAAGIAEGLVPANEPMTLQVYDKCGDEIFTTALGPFDKNEETGPYNLPVTGNSIQLNGQVFNCDHEPVKKGYVLVNTSDLYYKQPLKDDGNFLLNIALCQQVTFSVQAFDVDHLSASTLQFYTTSSAIKMDSVSACDQLQEYFLINVEGQELPYLSTLDSQDSIHECYNPIGIEHGQCFFYMCIPKEHPGYFPNTPCALELYSAAIEDTSLFTNTIDLKILKFEKPGGIIKASFSGEFQLSPQMYGPSPALPFKGEFVVKRK